MPFKTAPKAESAAACCVICKAFKNCTAWTWNGGSNKMCYPKTACSKVSHATVCVCVGGHYHLS